MFTLAFIYVYIYIYQLKCCVLCLCCFHRRNAVYFDAQYDHIYMFWMPTVCRIHFVAICCVGNETGYQFYCFLCFHHSRMVMEFVNTISYKPLVGSSLNLQLWCSWAKRLDFEVKRSRSQRDHTWWSKHFGRHFLARLWNACIYFNQTCHNYSLPGLHDTYDIFKLLGSKVKVTDIYSRCTFLVQAYWSTVCYLQRPSSSFKFSVHCMSLYVTSHPGEHGPAISLWVGKVSTSAIREANRYAHVWCTSP